MSLFNLPSLEGWCLKEVVTEAQSMCITIVATATQALCPICGFASPRVHSRYQRTIADVPLAGVSVRLLAQVRRFRCIHPTCPRQIFCERLGEAIAAYARRTKRLEVLFQRYGTLLCDLERHRVVDLLPDRQTETFATWLMQHPGVEVISRDRAGNYAEGGRLGAPKALQIADRWHILQNLALALDSVVWRHLRSFKPTKPAESSPEPKRRPRTSDLRLTSAQRQRREQLENRFRQVQGLYEQGKSLREIAEALEIDKNTLRYFIQSQPWAAMRAHRGRQAGETSLTPYLPYLHKRWKAGCQNGSQLWRELRAQGYIGSASSVKPYVALRNCASSLRGLSGIVLLSKQGASARKVMGKPKGLSLV